MKKSIAVTELLLISNGKYAVSDKYKNVSIYLKKPIWNNSKQNWTFGTKIKSFNLDNFNIEIPKSWEKDPSKAIISRSQAEQKIKSLQAAEESKQTELALYIGGEIEYKGKKYIIKSIDYPNRSIELSGKNETMLTSIQSVQDNLGRSKDCNRNAAEALQSIQDLFEDKYVTVKAEGIFFQYIKEGLFKKLNPEIEKKFYEFYGIIETYLGGE